jgi:hypothetical protein
VTHHGLSGWVLDSVQCLPAEPDSARAYSVLAAIAEGSNYTGQPTREGFGVERATVLAI